MAIGDFIAQPSYLPVANPPEVVPALAYPNPCFGRTDVPLARECLRCPDGCRAWAAKFGHICENEPDPSRDRMQKT